MADNSDEFILHLINEYIRNLTMFGTLITDQDIKPNKLKYYSTVKILISDTDVKVIKCVSFNRFNNYLTCICREKHNNEYREIIKDSVKNFLIQNIMVPLVLLKDIKDDLVQDIINNYNNNEKSSSDPSKDYEFYVEIDNCINNSINNKHI